MPMNQNVCALFEQAASAQRERQFLVVKGKPLLSYGDMIDETRRAAAWLASQGLHRGDRALVQMHKSPAAVILYLACLRAGITFIPLNTAYQEGELDYFIGDAQPGLLAASAGLAAERGCFGGVSAVIPGAPNAAPRGSTGASRGTV